MDGKLDTLQTNEIAEGVEIKLRVAGPTIRVFAWLIDLWIMVIAFIIISVALSMLVLVSEEIYDGLLMLVGFALTWIYGTAMEASRAGATLGKLMFGLRVVQSSGAPLTWRHSIIRNILRVADCMPLCGVVLFEMIPLIFITHLFGLFTCMSTRNFQRLGDLAADTVVIYKDKRVDPALLKMPLMHAQQANPVVPTCPLTREEQEAIIKFADRVIDWSPERQAELADHAQVLTNHKGPQGVVRLLGIAKWIRSNG